MVVINSLLPIFLIILLGNALKHVGMLNLNFIKLSDSLLYFLFLPGLLFWQIWKQPTNIIHWNLVLPTLISVFLVFALSLVYAKFSGMLHSYIGSFSQSCYRFNTYIGLAVVTATLGESGVREFGILVGFLIPFINLMAVSSLIWYAGGGLEWKQHLVFILRSVALNPLILSCIAGLLFSQYAVPMPTSIDKTLAMTSTMALPLALISIGGSLDLTIIKSHLKYSFIASLFKLILLPMVGFFILFVFGVKGPALTIGMIYFALPTSPNNYILSSQLHSNVELATSAVVLSTILSVFSLSVVLALSI